MGREYRLSGDPRLRQKGDRRDARIPPAVSASGIDFDPRATVAGIDVGENFLDIAVIKPESAILTVSRVGLLGIGAKLGERARTRGAIAQLARRIADKAPELRAGAIAMVDSPRWPRDMDLTRPGKFRRGDIQTRSLDAALRRMVVDLIEHGGAPALRPLALFPTPPRGYFDAHLSASACKPHLRALGRELFPTARPRPPYGGTFTRFMIAGFAAYRALEMLGVESYEAYPDLQFRLWAQEVNLPPKKTGRTARETRRKIIAALAHRTAIAGCEALRHLDELDAAALALSAFAAGRCGGALALLEHGAEGRFVVALDAGLAAAWPQARMRRIGAAAL